MPHSSRLLWVHLLGVPMLCFHPEMELPPSAGVLCLALPGSCRHRRTDLRMTPCHNGGHGHIVLSATISHRDFSPATISRREGVLTIAGEFAQGFCRVDEIATFLNVCASEISFKRCRAFELKLSTNCFPRILGMPFGTRELEIIHIHNQIY